MSDVFAEFAPIKPFPVRFSFNGREHIALMRGTTVKGIEQVGLDVSNLPIAVRVPVGERLRIARSIIELNGKPFFQVYENPQTQEEQGIEDRARLAWFDEKDDILFSALFTAYYDERRKQSSLIGEMEDDFFSSPRAGSGE